MFNIKSIKKILILIALCIALFGAVSARPALADANSLMWGGTEGGVDTALGLGNEDPRTVAAGVINVFLGFLGIVAVVIILLGGFKYMTSMGNEDQIEKAKDMITAAAIGLIIILMSWAISKFVIDLIYQKTGATG